MGGGVIGVATAWYLSQAGCEVTVIDRQNQVGLETSFANCGEISPGYASPWAAPGIPIKALKWLLSHHAPLKIHPDWSLFQLKFLRLMLANCNNQAYNLNKKRMLQLSEYSRDKFRQLRQQIGIGYEDRQLGTLQLFRHQHQLDNVKKDIQVLNEYNIPFNLLDQNGCAQVEPALNIVKDKFVGGLQLPGDETGDCFIFTQKLAQQCINRGLSFALGKSITAFEHTNDKINAIYCNQERFTADHFVVALGSFSRQLLQTLNISIPVYPVKGYSLTLPITNPDLAPVSTILDDTYKVAITRFDKRIRVGGMAELSGYNLNLNPKRLATLKKVVNDLYPKGGDLAKATFWTGLRPMTPDGTPIIGSTRITNLSINTGHGTFGYTMSLGSGKILADSIIGITPEIDINEFSLNRY